MLVFRTSNSILIMQTVDRVILERVRAAVAIGNADLLSNVGTIMAKISVPVAFTGKQGEATVFKRKSNEEHYNII